MKKAVEGIDLSCFYGMDRLIMNHPDVATMALSALPTIKIRRLP
ncbi:MAG: hypothetical protein PHR71_05235 [Polaromonas sp.]|nr:hypothetical protein [Polaromonas sp.]